MDLSDLRKTAIATLDQRDAVPDEGTNFACIRQSLRLQHELEILRDEFVGLFDCASVGYVTIHADNRIVKANVTIPRLLGMPREKLTGLDFAICLAGQ